MKGKSSAAPEFIGDPNIVAEVADLLAKAERPVALFGTQARTCRAHDAIDKLAPFLSVLSKPNWTGQAALPGGAFDVARTDARMREYQARWPFLAPVTLSRLFHAYGSDLPTLLGDAKAMADLGPLFGADLTAREVDYLVANEWARSADDILWRRTKLGLRFTSEQATALAEKLG